MSTDPSTPENDANLSGLGRALLETGGSKPSSGPWVPPTAEELGKLLPEYEVLKMLGRGGMGAVYMGRQKSLERAVAIKILSTALEDADPSFAERFKNEARAMGKLNHPGVVAVHDFGEAEGGLLYIVMEYVEGTDVAKMIAKEGRLHTEHAMAITAHVCDALAYAHERGIIHRDIKPANIMVGFDGVVKVADFGLAKMTHSNSKGLTQSGMTMGTLHYMAPECLMLGTAVDHRADIYAVGVMLYQMLTGKIPQGMFELPSLQVKGLDPRYDGIIAKALREDREARYQSIREMRGDLDNILTQPVAKVEPEISQAPVALPTQVRPQRPGGQPYRPPQSVVQHKPAKKASSAWLVWAALCLLALCGGCWIFNKSASQREPLNRSEAEIASHGLPGGQAERGSPLSGANGPAVTNPPTTPAQRIPSGASQVGTTLSAAAATKDAPFVNSLGMKFVPVPITGGPTSGQRVLFSIWETRVQDYEIFVKETNRDWPKPDFVQERTHPAVNVSWSDAREFCAWLTRREISAGKIGLQDQYRLPADHEWSCAVGIGSRERAEDTPAAKDRKLPGQYPWGASWPPPAASGNFNGSETAVNSFKGTPLTGYDDGYPRTSPAGAFVANNLNLHDLGGNVIEWCADAFDGGSKKTARGSSWRDGQEQYHASANRFGLPPDHADDRTGFRVVLELSAPAVMSMPATSEKPGRIDGLFANGEWQDVLTMIAEKPSDSTGTWIWKEGVLRCQSAVTNAQRSIVTAPLASYQARVRVRAEQNSNVALFLPTPAGAATLIFSDYRDVIVMRSWERPWKGSLKGGSLHELRVVINEKTITIDLDGERLVDQGTVDWKEINQGDRYPTTQPLGLGVGVHMGTANFESFELLVPAPSQGVAGGIRADSSLPVLPEVRTRVANYQKARHAQLAELTAKYRSALTTEKDTATKSGVLANVTNAEAAIVAASAYAQAIEAQLNATEVKPLPALAAVVDPAPSRLKELRDIFVREVAKIETTLITGLDSSLATVQASLVQSDKLTEARAVEDCRRGMMAGFRGAAEKVGGTEVVRSSTSNKQQIPADAPAFGGSRYYLFTDAMTWQQARAKAETMGGHLATITTAEEDAWVRNTFGPRLAVGQLFLIGASQERSDSPWQWVTGEPWNFTAWYGGAPNNLNLRNKVKQTPPFCLCYYKRDKDLSWNDLSQSQPIAKQGSFLVEWESGATSSASSGMPGSSTLATATKDKPFVNSLGMKFVPVPGTKVLFCIHETRRMDYASFDAKRPGLNAEWKATFRNGIPVGHENDHPVVSVSWVEASEFCRWLSDAEGRNYRLPTDNEWSHAVGLTSNDTPVTPSFPWGTTWPPPPGAANLADEAAFAAGLSRSGHYLIGYDDGFPTTAPAMSFQPNALGIFDLSGNVSEWCDDWIRLDKNKKVHRGGSWEASGMDKLVLDGRPSDVWTPGVKQRNDIIGFRPVLEVPAVTTDPASVEDARMSPSTIKNSNSASALPATATKDTPFVNSLGMKFVPVPGTKVLMCIHETRKGDYEAYANEQTAIDGTWRNVTHRGLVVSASDDHPVCAVSWNEAKAFCDWLSARENQRYRLPSDREWSFAVGIGDREDPDRTPYELKNGVPDVWPWGTSFPPPSPLENLADKSLQRAVPDHRCIANYDDGFPTTAPVMSFPPNAIGLYDMGGNVCEWVEDAHGGKFANERSLRMNGFLGFPKEWCLSSHRTPRDPVKTHAVDSGFRVVIELP